MERNDPIVMVACEEEAGGVLVGLCLGGHVVQRGVPGELEGWVLRGWVLKGWVLGKKVCGLGLEEVSHWVGGLENEFWVGGGVG